jgi:hypothetical protein
MRRRWWEGSWRGIPVPMTSGQKALACALAFGITLILIALAALA